MCVWWQCVKTNNNNKNRNRAHEEEDEAEAQEARRKSLIRIGWQAHFTQVMFWAINFLAAIATGYTIPHTATISVVYPFYARAAVCVCAFSICLLNCWLLFVSSSSFENLLCVWFHYIAPHHTLFSRSLFLLLLFLRFNLSFYLSLSPLACLL